MSTDSTSVENGASPTPSVSIPRLIIATSIGNALEVFDLVIYGFFASSISKQFFPASSKDLSLILAFGTFGISYLIRPIGALVLGAYADRAGRKASMLVSIILMMVGTLMIAVMPSYGAIGVLAPIGILVSRLLQGFSAGGEFGSATSILVEHGPARRGFMSSWQFASQGLSIILASILGVLLTRFLGKAEIDEWGWRLPFFFGLLIGPVGLYIRRHINESLEFSAGKHSKSPVKDLFFSQKVQILCVIGATILSNASAYLFLYMPTYANQQLNLPTQAGFVATLTVGIVLTIIPPFAGHLSDKFGRTRIMGSAALLFALTAYPAFLLLSHFRSIIAMVLLMGWLGLLKAAYCGALPALMSESFPSRTRATGMALSYNVAATLFGGFSPAIITFLIHVTADKMAPGFYMLICAALSLCSVLALSRRNAVAQL